MGKNTIITTPQIWHSTLSHGRGRLDILPRWGRSGDGEMTREGLTRHVSVCKREGFCGWRYDVRFGSDQSARCEIVPQRPAGHTNTDTRQAKPSRLSHAPSPSHPFVIRYREAGGWWLASCVLCGKPPRARQHGMGNLSRSDAETCVSFYRRGVWSQ